jgi:Ribonuclease G/E
MIQCIVADEIRPATEYLEAAARVTDEDLRREFGERWRTWTACTERRAKSIADRPPESLDQHASLVRKRGSDLIAISPERERIASPSQ